MLENEELLTWCLSHSLLCHSSLHLLVGSISLATFITTQNVKQVAVYIVCFVAFSAIRSIITRDNVVVLIDASDARGLKHISLRNVTCRNEERK
jgi:hypothetical protein